MHRFAADRPPRPSKRELAAAAAASAPTGGERSRGISDEAIFTGKTEIVGTNPTKYPYINVADGLLYYYSPTNSTMYINDNGKQYSFTIGAGNETILLRVVKYHGQYYFFYVMQPPNQVATTLQRYDPVANTVTDLGLRDYAGYGFLLESLSRLEIVNGLLLFGVYQIGKFNDSERKGLLHCIQSDHTVLVSHSDETMYSLSNFFKHGQNLIVCDTYGWEKIIYKPLSALGISGGWNSISLPAGYKSLWRMQLVNGEIYGIDKDNGAFTIYTLSSDYNTWAQVGQKILATDYIEARRTDYGDLKYIGGSLYLFPFYEKDRIFKLVSNTWTRVAHPTDANLELLLDVTYTLDGTFKQSGGDMYIAAFVKNKTTNIKNGVIIKFTAAGVLSVIPPDEPTSNTSDSAVIDGALYIGRGMEFLLIDSNGVATKRDTTLTRGNNSSDYIILYVYYYGGQVYVNYEDGSIWRANLVTPGAVASALSKDTQPAVFKNILTNGVTVPKTIPLTNVDARGIVNATDIAASGGALNDYASLKVIALSAANAASPYPSFDVTSSDLTSALLYVPFDNGGVVIRLGGVDYTLLFDSNAIPKPTLSVNGAPVAFGSNFSLGGTELRFLSRGSIILSSATDRNSFPVRVGRALYTCHDRTIVYTKETVYNLRDGKTLPSAQGRYKAVAGNILQDIGETVNITRRYKITWPDERITTQLQYVFRLVQLVSGGAVTGGVSGSPADDYVSGFVCTWAESGRPPINLS